MDDLSSIWMSGSGRCRGRYDRWNVFESQHCWEKWFWKNLVFFEFIYFSNRAGSMIARMLPFLQSISMRKRLMLNFRSKCRRSFLFPVKLCPRLSIYTVDWSGAINLLLSCSLLKGHEKLISGRFEQIRGPLPKNHSKTFILATLAIRHGLGEDHNEKLPRNYPLNPHSDLWKAVL